MLKIGITGGIGSGKTIVCQVFETLGIPVFYADVAARHLMENSAGLIEQIKGLFGSDIYMGKSLQKDRLAAVVFSDREKLNALNALVHPATIQYGRDWMIKQSTPYAIKEAAIFFESGSSKDMDLMIGVYAPDALRIKRAMTRDGATETKIRERIAQQMNEDEKMKLCDYVITNDGNTPIIPQILELHKELLVRSQA